MMDKSIITIEADKVMVETHYGGVVNKKRISNSDFIKCFGNAVTNVSISTGILPYGTLYINRNEKSVSKFAALYPDNKADIIYYEDVFCEFPLPKLVFAFKFSDNMRVDSLKIGVTENTEKLNENSRMYLYPFSNLYKNSILCWGNNELPQVSSMLEIPRIMKMVMELPNNDDLFCGSNNRLNMSYSELLKHLADKKPEYYYSDILVDAGYTLGEFLGLESD